MRLSAALWKLAQVTPIHVNLAKTRVVCDRAEPLICLKPRDANISCIRTGPEYEVAMARCLPPANVNRPFFSSSSARDALALQSDLLNV